jgi:uncharacterized protein YecT (DUF1311 family)
MKITLLAVMLLLLTGLFAFAQTPKKKPEPCADAQTQADMNICWGNEYKNADGRLNQVYREFMTKLNEEEKTELKNAQVAWLKYRDTNCEFVADQYKGGSIRPMIAAICLANATNDRTNELKAQIKERDQ